MTGAEAMWGDKQIPFGNDKTKGKATAKADSLWE
jgi:hypothetical protein